MSKKVADKVANHPDFDEIVSKLCLGISSKDISEWLAAKYAEVEDRSIILSEKSLEIFKRDYLDFYNTIKKDLQKTAEIQKNPNQGDVQLALQNNITYQNVLSKYLNDEVDIKIIIKKMVAALEYRIDQIYSEVVADPSNMRPDRTLIEYFNTLSSILEKYDQITLGINPDQINIQNNINIQIVDKHINVVFDIIKDILTKLDYDTSLLFVEMFNEAMRNLKSPIDAPQLSQDGRLQEAKLLQQNISNKEQ